MKIVGIHGIGHEHLTAPQIEGAWLPAIQGGLEVAGFPRISLEDFTVASYGDLFRPEVTRSGRLPKLSVDDVTEEWETDLLVEWWREAAALSARNREHFEESGEELTIQGIDFEGRGRTPAIVQRALRNLVKTKFFEKLGGERAVLYLLKQVKAYLHDEAMKKAIQDRVVAKVTPETQVIVAHSLGSVVAYECLCKHLDWNVQTLVTVGSPLGIRPSIFEALVPKPVNGLGQFPRVKQWFNIADAGDIVALEKKLQVRFGDGVGDSMVNNGWESHSAERYLNTKEAGQAIASGLMGGV